MKTRKYRKKIKKNIYGGESKENAIMRQVKKDNDIVFNLGKLPVVIQASNLLTGLTIKGLQRFGQLIGVDLSNTEDFSEKLDQIKIALADPKNKEKIRKIIEELANTGAIMLEAAGPFLEQLVDKSIKIGSESITKIAEAAVKVALNTAEEIPVAGIVIGMVRSLSNAGEAALAATNATNQMITSTSNTINAASKNYERLIKEKMNSENRINKSVTNFNKSLIKPSLLNKTNNRTAKNITK
jgi:hypothetical protein